MMSRAAAAAGLILLACCTSNPTAAGKAKEGEACGGIAGLICDDGLWCDLQDPERSRGRVREEIGDEGKFLRVAESSTLNKLDQSYADILQGLTDAPADYDATVLAAGQAAFYPIASLTTCD